LIYEMDIRSTSWNSMREIEFDLGLLSHRKKRIKLKDSFSGLKNIRSCQDLMMIPMIRRKYSGCGL